jgi:hypothetical protein
MIGLIKPNGTSVMEGLLVKQWSAKWVELLENRWDFLKTGGTF